MANVGTVEGIKSSEKDKVVARAIANEKIK